jgi:carbonic anhydrase/acetyltransferase-like protein (isoleucine patch superfamily)
MFMCLSSKLFFSCTVQPSMRNAVLGKHTPTNAGSFVAPSATVVGNVSIGEHSSVWYNAVLRGMRVLGVFIA